MNNNIIIELIAYCQAQGVLSTDSEELTAELMSICDNLTAEDVEELLY